MLPKIIIFMFMNALLCSTTFLFAYSSVYLCHATYVGICSTYYYHLYFWMNVCSNKQCTSMSQISIYSIVHDCWHLYFLRWYFRCQCRIGLWLRLLFKKCIGLKLKINLGHWWHSLAQSCRSLSPPYISVNSRFTRFL